MHAAIKRQLNAISTKVARALKVDEISTRNLPADAANRMRQNQIRGAIDQMRVFVVGNNFFAPVLAFQAWNSGINGIVFGWTCAHLLFSWWLFFNWNKSYQTDGSQKDMDAFVRETQINAGLWCLGMVLFYPFVSGDEKTAINTIMTGSLALGTVGFSQAPRAAFWFLGIHTFVLVAVLSLSGLYWHNASDLLLAGLAIIAGGAIFSGVIERARAQMKAFTNHESLLQKSEIIDLLLKDYEEQGVEWVWRTDAQGRILTCPQQVLDLVGNFTAVGGARQTPDRAPSILSALAAHIEAQGISELDKVGLAFANRAEFHDVSLPLYSEEQGTIRWIMMRGRPQFEGDEFVGFRGIFADATTRVEAKLQVEFLAERDPLTNVYNRNFIQAYLEKLNAEHDKAMIYLVDLDGFKQVNDSYGHAVGDKLLQKVSRRLVETACKNDFVARLGGDEFLVLTDEPSKSSRLSADALSARLLSKLSEPFIIDQYDVALSASIGTANFPQDTDVGPNLLNLADLALYAAKKSGRNRCLSFVQKMQTGLQNRMVVADRLRLAVQRNDIVPYFQPQYCSQTLKLVGFEALARWNDSELGVVGPDIFIPIAEETGLIHEIGKSVLLTACQAACNWPSPTGGSPPSVAVNFSAVQVMRGNVVETVDRVLKQTQLSPDRLEVEVTESVLIEDVDGTREVLQALADLGVRIALDDFGTGYSSLSYLRALPLHRLKIDRSFVSDIDDLEAQSVVQTIIDLCRRLDLEVIAEGVETEENVKLLGEMHCDILQGYYFSKPVPLEDIDQFLTPDKASVA